MTNLRTEPKLFKTVMNTEEIYEGSLWNKKLTGAFFEKREFKFSLQICKPHREFAIKNWFRKEILCL